LSEDLTRTLRDRLYAARVNQGYGRIEHGYRIDVGNVHHVARTAEYDLPIAHLIAVDEGTMKLRNVPNGQLGLDGAVRSGIHEGATLRSTFEALEANPNYEPPHFLGNAGETLEQTVERLDRPDTGWTM
jgi:hypothetical protein